VPDDVMVAARSARTTLCVLAAAGALSGGLGGALLVGRLATGDELQAAVARDAPAAVAGSRHAAQVAAARSVLRQPTPWSAAIVAQAARLEAMRHPRRHVATRRPAAAARAPVAARAPAAPVSAPASTVAVTHARSGSATQTGGATAPHASTPAPEPRRAPAAPRPQPKPKPKPTPKPDARPQQPTGAFDDSG
jgi:hypothetical protein